MKMLRPAPAATEPDREASLCTGKKPIAALDEVVTIELIRSQFCSSATADREEEE
jgi:hypothetical protein